MMTTTFTPTAACRQEVDLTNLLRGMAWLGCVSSRHVRELWLPHRTIDRARTLLNRLYLQGVVEVYRWYVPRQELVQRRRDQRPIPAPPRRAGHWWTLTKKGLDLATTLAGEPLRSVGLRAPQLLAHDRLVVETLVQMIALARPHGLSGVYVEREALLNPPARRPRMDAVIVLRLQPGQATTWGVPWTAQPPLPREIAHRFALEIDNATEGNNEITVKALAYRQAAQAAWAQRSAAFPLPVWVVPHPERRDRIHALWQQAWPDGQWLLTTEADLHADRWLAYAGGMLCERPLFSQGTTSTHVHEGGEYAGT